MAVAVGRLRLINAQTKGRMAAVKELDSLQASATNDMKEFISEAASVATAGLSSCNQMLEMIENDKELIASLGHTAAGVKELHTFIEQATGARDQVADLKKALDAWKKGELNEEIVRRLADQVKAKANELLSTVELLSKNNRKFVDRVLARHAFVIGSIQGLVKMTNKTFNILEMHQLTSQISDSLGEKAQMADKIRVRHRAATDDYLQTRDSLVKVLEAEK